MHSASKHKKRTAMVALLMFGFIACCLMVATMWGYTVRRWAIGQQLEYYCSHTFPKTDVRLHCIEPGMEKHNGP